MRASLSLTWSLLLLAAGSALAQSSPYAGSWAGMTLFHGTTVCTCSGSASCPSPNTSTCESNYPWTAKIDLQGNLGLATGPGVTTCTGNGFVNSFPTAMIQYGGHLSSTGSVSFLGGTSSSSNGIVTCQPFTMQFALAPPSMSAVAPCTFVQDSPNPSGGTLSCTSNFTNTFTGAKTASIPPPFPMTVSTSITTTTANATAQVQPPPQLVGTSASVYVFGHARLSSLGKREAVRLADEPAPDPCVLVQLDSNGQLVAVSASSLRASITGIVNSQAQSVAILNNVPTPRVAGSSFYVGFGTTPGSMFSNGLYQGAVIVPGSNACTAELFAGAAPTAPGALSGQWWNPSESGWGVSLSQRNATVFAAWYTYDGVGHPKWYVASCAMTSAGTSGTCNGSLSEVRGPTFFGTDFDPARVQVTSPGTLQIRFDDVNNASMNYTVNGQSRTVAITRQVFQAGTIPPAVDYTDLWWNPQESGWGIALTQQYGMIFVAWFVYDADAKPIWYVASCVVVGSACSGTLYKTTGPPLGPAFDAAAVQASSVGSVNIGFINANNAMLSYTVNGISSAKIITRQLF